MFSMEAKLVGNPINALDIVDGINWLHSLVWRRTRILVPASRGLITNLALTESIQIWNVFSVVRVGVMNLMFSFLPITRITCQIITLC